MENETITCDIFILTTAEEPSELEMHLEKTYIFLYKISGCNTQTFQVRKGKQWMRESSEFHQLPKEKF